MGERKKETNKQKMQTNKRPTKKQTNKNNNNNDDFDEIHHDSREANRINHDCSLFGKLYTHLHLTQWKAYTMFAEAEEDI